MTIVTDAQSGKPDLSLTKSTATAGILSTFFKADLAVVDAGLSDEYSA